MLLLFCNQPFSNKEYTIKTRSRHAKNKNNISYCINAICKTQKVGYISSYSINAKVYLLFQGVRVGFIHEKGWRILAEINHLITRSPVLNSDQKLPRVPFI